MKKKAILALFMAGIMVSAVGCGNKNKSKPSNEDENSAMTGEDFVDGISSLAEQMQKNKEVTEKALSQELLFTDELGNVTNMLFTKTPLEEAADGKNIVPSDYKNKVEAATNVSDKDIQDYIDEQVAALPVSDESLSTFVKGTDTINIDIKAETKSSGNVLYDFKGYSYDLSTGDVIFHSLRTWLSEKPVGYEFKIGYGDETYVVDGYICKVSGVINYVEGKNAVEYGPEFIRQATNGACSTDAEYREYIKKMLSTNTTNKNTFDSLIEAADVDMKAYKDITDNIVEAKKKQLSDICDAKNMSVAEYAKALGKTEDELYSSLEDETLETAKKAIIASAIINMEKIDINDDVLNEAAQKYLDAQGYNTAHEYLTTHLPAELRFAALTTIVTDYLAKA